MPVALAAGDPPPAPWSPIRDLQSSLVWFYPGAAQGITTVLLGHPLDTAKTRLQADQNQTLKTRSSTKVMCGMFKQEGIRSLYKGVTPPLLVMGSKRSLQFALWERIKRPVAAEKIDPTSSTGGTSTSSPNTAREAVMGVLLDAKQRVASSNFLSGALSGAVGTILGCPMHVIKIQTQNGTTADSRNAFECAKHVWRAEGVKGYYRGFPAHVMKDVLFAGTYLGLYESIRVCLTPAAPASPKYDNAEEGGVGDGDERGMPEVATRPPLLPKLNLPESLKGSSNEAEDDDRCASITSPSPRSGNLVVFTAGTIASCITWVCLYPFDTLKTSIQARNALTIRTFISGPNSFLSNPMKAYRGLAAALVRAGPVSGLAMVVYESVKANVNASPPPPPVTTTSA